MNLSDNNAKLWKDIFKSKLENPNLDYTKLDRQLTIYTNWIVKFNGRGYLSACTGFGKTIVALLSIISLNHNDTNRKTIVIVPNTNLYNDWCDPNYGYISTLGLVNVKVYVVNTYTAAYSKYNCDLLILDEGHRYARTDAKKFSKVIGLTNFKFILILSATLGDQERKFFESYGIKEIDNITLDEAQSKGWVSDYIVYNVGTFLSDADAELEKKYTTAFNTCHAFFERDWHLARACNIKNESYFNHPKYGKNTGKQFREYIANKYNISEQEVRKTAGAWYMNMRMRKEFLHKSVNKTDIVEEILNYTNYKTIVFSELSEIGANLKLRLGEEAVVYNSSLPTQCYDQKGNLVAESVKIEGQRAMYKAIGGRVYTLESLKNKFGKITRIGGNKLKKKIKDDFSDDKYRIMLTTKALDEGYDEPSIVMGIIHSGSSKELQLIQRFGRIIRSMSGKLAILVNVYVRGTKDEDWLKSRLKGVPPSKMRWIDDISQITHEINETLLNKDDDREDIELVSIT